jgi:hypothetical protein
MIIWMMGSKEYKKIKDITLQQVESSLKDKRGILLVALVAIIEAFKLDPEKQILISSPANDGVNQHYYLQRQRKELLELAEQIHNAVANEMVNGTMNSISIDNLFPAL